MSDDAPKSALELAMERLKKKDEEEGRVERPLTDDQRARIAEVKRIAGAKLAEREILHRSALQGARDPEAYAAIEEEHGRDRERIVAERDKKVDDIRREGS
jgi:hypothetical protein